MNDDTADLTGAPAEMDPSEIRGKVEAALHEIFLAYGEYMKDYILMATTDELSDGEGLYVFHSEHLRPWTARGMMSFAAEVVDDTLMSRTSNSFGPDDDDDE